MSIETPKLKDYFDARLADQIGQNVQRVYPPFDNDALVAFVKKHIPTQELKARVATIADGLRTGLPDDYPAAIDILLKTLGDPLPDDGGMFVDGYHVMPLARFVEVYGTEHFETSMQAIYEITKRFTSEFAIRPYIERYTDECLTLLKQWATDPNPHVRRLVSEGTRTRLPWASRLDQFIENPRPVIALLTILRDDDSAYVRKSVANNLNDISKDHPELVVSVLHRWLQDATPQREWIAKHALRTLLKDGHRGALDLLGFSIPSVQIENFSLEPQTVAMGGTFTLRFDINNTAADTQHLMVDYIVHFVRANGKQNAKVFKLKTTTLHPGERISIEKQHSFKAVTVRRYYAGAHRIDIQINGMCIASGSVTLTT